MKKTFLFIVLSILIFTVLQSCNKNSSYPNNSKINICSSDSDCVPAQCCHPTGCVLKDAAPDCKGIMCTAECKPGTLDCGQGSCKCVDKKCEVVMA